MGKVCTQVLPTVYREQLSESKHSSSVDAQQPLLTHDRDCVFEAQTSQTENNLSLLHALGRLVSRECTKSVALRATRKSPC